MLRKMPRQPQFIRHAVSINRLCVSQHCAYRNDVWKNSAWPELKLRPYARAAGASGSAWIECARNPEGSMAGDRSTASREPWAPTALGRACAPLIGVALVEDRGRDRPQADFTVLIPTNRIGLRPELVSTH